MVTHSAADDTAHIETRYQTHSESQVIDLYTVLKIAMIFGQTKKGLDLQGFATVCRASINKVIHRKLG
jgi:hypothetical protein